MTCSESFYSILSTLSLRTNGLEWGEIVLQGTEIEKRLIAIKSQWLKEEQDLIQETLSRENGKSLSLWILMENKNMFRVNKGCIIMDSSSLT